MINQESRIEVFKLLDPQEVQKETLAHSDDIQGIVLYTRGNADELYYGLHLYSKKGCLSKPIEVEVTVDATEVTYHQASADQLLEIEDGEEDNWLAEQEESCL